MYGMYFLRIMNFLNVIIIINNFLIGMVSVVNKLNKTMLLPNEQPFI